MKVVILAGGFGTRLEEETALKPKPMVEIGGKPILWHIMKIYSQYGFNEFIICLGYKGYLIKEYFYHHLLHNSNVTMDLVTNQIDYFATKSEPWKVHLIETGYKTQTGGRVKRIKKYVENETFMLTYGDGVADVNILQLIKCHQKNKKIITLSAVQPFGRFGTLRLNHENDVINFKEKAKGEASWINGGFYVVEPAIFPYIAKDQTRLEQDVLEKLASKKQVNAYIHKGFWKCMDHPRDKAELEELWNTNKAGWKTWKK